MFLIRNTNASMINTMVFIILKILNILKTIKYVIIIKFNYHKINKYIN